MFFCLISVWVFLAIKSSWATICPFSDFFLKNKKTQDCMNFFKVCRLVFCGTYKPHSLHELYFALGFFVSLFSHVEQLPHPA
jgi:hypothetical protein